MYKVNIDGFREYNSYTNIQPSKIKTRYCHNLYELVKTCTKFLNRKIGKPIFIVGYY